MNDCIIMHNMIIESERDPAVLLPPRLPLDHYVRNPFDGQGNLEPIVIARRRTWRKTLQNFSRCISVFMMELRTNNCKMI